jgi:crotonobetainyl-CoA:carnitine CoA-transferase CaiB-like acyl-CoA transferase
MRRGVGPYYLGEGDSEFYQSINRNKKSLTLDLKTDSGQRILHRLVATADGLLDNLRGDKPDSLGITYDDLSRSNPRIVCAHLSAYGRDGPRRTWPGYDFLLQCEAGFLSLTGEPDGPPSRIGLSMVDFMTGTLTVLSLVSSILAARETGKGRDVEVSLYDVAMHQLTYPAAWYLNSGLETGRAPRSAHPYIVPSQLYRTGDGWIFLMCQTQRFWELLCERIGHPELAADPAYRGYAERLEQRERLTEILDGILGERTTDEWIEVLGGTVPCAPVRDLAGALDNPFFVERGGVQEIPHPDKEGGILKLVASPLRVGEAIPARPAPKLGQHTDELLAELGYDECAIADLKKEGVV